MSSPAERQVQALGAVLQLEQSVRNAPDEEAFGFIVVNDTHHLVPYRQAVLWRAGLGRGRVTAVSGLPYPDRNAPFVQWLDRVAWHLALAGPGPTRTLVATDLPESLAKEWSEWLPPHAVWTPLTGSEASEAVGGLVLARDETWEDNELRILDLLAGAYGHAWQAMRHRPRWRLGVRLRRNRLVLAALVVSAGLMWLPVRISVLAPAEVAPLDPTVVRAPLDGIVEIFHVRPNQAVEKGALLLELDKTDLANRLTVAEKELAVVRAEYRQTAQRAVLDQKSKATLAILQGRMEAKEAELAHVQTLLERADIRAARDGIVVIADVDDWIGRPVAVGQRILSLASPDQAQLDIRLPVADAIALEPGSEVAMFLNIDPIRPVTARLRTASYEAELTPEGTLAYRLKATFDTAPPPRIGLRGTAKILGQRVTLFYWIMRRPLATARQWLGM